MSCGSGVSLGRWRYPWIQLGLELPRRAVQIADMKRTPVKLLQRWPCFPLYCNHRADCGEDEEKTPRWPPLSLSPQYTAYVTSIAATEIRVRELWLGFSNWCLLKAIWEGDKVPYEYREEQQNLVRIVSVHTHLIKRTCFDFSTYCL